jgi:hypothetical protein
VEVATHDVQPRGNAAVSEGAAWQLSGLKQEADWVRSPFARFFAIARPLGVEQRRPRWAVIGQNPPFSKQRILPMERPHYNRKPTVNLRAQLGYCGH